jgi:hypothetical protein
MSPYNNAYLTTDGRYSPAVGPIEHIYFDPLLREWILSLIAASGLEVDYYLTHQLGLKLKPNGRGTLKGRCPWCGGEESFTFSKKTLFAGCAICERKDDLLGLICEQKKFRDMYLALEELRVFKEFPPVNLMWARVWRKEPAKEKKGGKLCK